MKLAIISDIHGNRLALEAVLDDIARRDVDAIVNLGDLVAGPMDPAGVAELLMGLDMPTVRGNHERALFDPDLSNSVDAFAFDRLGAAQREWIAALPARRVVGDVFLCHGTPASDMEPWLDAWWTGRTVTVPDEADVAAHAAGIAQPLLLCGHTHVARAVRLRDGRLIVNPGSVGLQFHYGSPDARYATVELREGRYQPTLHMVPYDHEGAARQAEANGFPLWRETLTTGWTGVAGLF